MKIELIENKVYFNDGSEKIWIQAYFEITDHMFFDIPTFVLIDQIYHMTKFIANIKER